jgi:mono/diheme cytochrome c family protein
MNLFTKSILATIATAFVIQLIPYGKDHANPPVVREPVWNSTATRELAKKACFDCHSNETTWPWYSKVAPISWLVYWDVVEGRDHLNFSDWRGGSRKSETPHEITKEVSEGEMPPLQYTIAHPETRLDAQSKKRLIDGLAATAAGSMQK